MRIGPVRLMNLNTVILSTTSDFKLRKTQNITDIILFYNSKKTVYATESKNGIQPSSAENRKTKNKINFHKILSFLCQECCPLKSFLSLLISICLLAFSPHNASVQQILTKLISQHNTQPQTRNGRIEEVA